MLATIEFLLATGLSGGQPSSGSPVPPTPSHQDSDEAVGDFSVELRAGVPAFGGLTFSYWSSEWLLFDVSAQYSFKSEGAQFLAGPRFRSAGVGLALGPVGLAFALQAGAMNHVDHGLRFGLSPHAGLEAALHRRFLIGFAYAVDIPFGRGEIIRRVVKTVGYRF